MVVLHGLQHQVHKFLALRHAFNKFTNSTRLRTNLRGDSYQEPPGNVQSRQQGYILRAVARIHQKMMASKITLSANTAI